MPGDYREELYNLISNLGLIDKELVKDCYEQSVRTGEPLENLIYEKDLINEDNLGKIVGDILGLPYVNLNHTSIQHDVYSVIPENISSKHSIIGFKKDEKEMCVATSEPQNTEVVAAISKKVGSPVKVFYTLKNGIEKARMQYSSDIGAVIRSLLEKPSSDLPIIEIVDQIIDFAYKDGASDIHIEPLEQSTLVRFRIDGVMWDILKLPIDMNPRLVTRIKVMAKLRTDEHQDSQDGKLIYKTSGEDLDVRVSIVPITRGEKVVMRLLTEKFRQFSLTELGLTEKDLKKVEEAYKMPHGMILVTGPTGSGKTTTLYALLKILNKRGINIMTIEDPVEYQIDNVNQIQVNVKTDLTFASGLRSIVRQDPDVILVGEIRDNETADIAVNSAMTGHLVLSSMHTNDAVTTFPRLNDMSVEPYLVSSTVNVVIAQRLVRKICVSCRMSCDVAYNGSTFSGYKGRGCAVCHGSGYKGRIGIFEVLTVEKDLNNAITAKMGIRDLESIAIKQGMVKMFDDGLEKVKQGLTTLEELVRVSKD